METTIELRRLFDFSQLPIIITGAVLAALTVTVLMMFLYSVLKDIKRKEKEVIEEKPVFVKPDMPKLKAEYLALLDGIEARFNQDTTKIRPAYEDMSRVVREFVYKATGTEVDKFTLFEISRTDFGDLAKLVGEYYQPEFDQISEGDVRASLEKSRRLVSEWN
ncbi:hypothetical protein [Butyrivibrio sp. AE2032]|uniref:hypothetical protein n=1 Tax=Butyrivibrio sp. AE2032 TaxID=1458463 RepID=UPI000554E4B3|nr:hypothetical protein [Butyrivibrio sp. AE2032]